MRAEGLQFLSHFLPTMPPPQEGVQESEGVLQKVKRVFLITGATDQEQSKRNKVLNILEPQPIPVSIKKPSFRHFSPNPIRPDTVTVKGKKKKVSTS